MGHPGEALVVKVGGSLFSEAPPIAAGLKGPGRPLLIVPGGGPFARLVWSMHIPDEQAHWMAILAMEQFGWYLASAGLPVTQELSPPRGVEILLPYEIMRERDPLPHSWDVTSDTIAAWVASELGLGLLLLKSVDGIRGDGGLLRRVAAPVPTDVVDPSLIPFALAHGVRVTIVNGRGAGRIRDFLEGREVSGTVIEPRV